MDNLLLDEKYIDINETVSILGVSSATIRNWVRSQHLVPRDDIGVGLQFSYDEVEILRRQIESGEIDRLSSRANKKHSTATFIPGEYVENRIDFELVEQIIDQAHSNQQDSKVVLFALILNLLRRKNLASFAKLNNSRDLSYKNDFIEQEVAWWLNETGVEIFNQTYTQLLSLTLPENTDILGLIYQSIRLEGNKSASGAYYTPKDLVERMIRDSVTSDSFVLDPCCGTGQFLIAASRVPVDPQNLWGFDLDEIAVRIARINLILAYPDTNFTPNIFCQNTLFFEDRSLFSTQTLPLFDVVITNPPWGAHFSRDDSRRLKRIYSSVLSGESFSYFIMKALDLLRPQGKLSFLLPESILNIKTHQDIRSFILSTTTIQTIEHLDRVFKNVFTPVVRIDLTKAKAANNRFVAKCSTKTLTVDQARLESNPGYSFDIFANNSDLSLLKKIFQTPHTTLANKADWALGIVTGNNKKYVLDCKAPGSEPLLTGKNIKKFLSTDPDNFIKFEPHNFQQVAPEEKFRAKEKLLYKFISKELIFSYDDKMTLTLNSANILIPKIDNYPLKTILALFNSTLYQFIFQKKFSTFKILRGDLEQLPLPILNSETHNRIESSVNKLLHQDATANERLDRYNRLNDLIMDIFELKNHEQAYVKENVSLTTKSLR